MIPTTSDHSRANKSRGGAQSHLAKQGILGTLEPNGLDS